MDGIGFGACLGSAGRPPLPSPLFNALSSGPPAFMESLSKPQRHHEEEVEAKLLRLHFPLRRSPL